MKGTAFYFLAFAISAAAQTAVTNNNDGTTGTIPVYAGSAALTNSVITQSGSNVGIGTTAPAANLHVVSPSNGGGEAIFQNTGGSQDTGITLEDTSSNWKLGDNLYGSGVGKFGILDNNTPAVRLVIDKSGNVGIGTTSPGANYKLDVAGAINTSVGVYFPNGGLQTTAFNPANCGADYAESVDVTGDRTKYEPGDLMVIDPDAPGKFLKSNQAYSTLVAGIFSTKPGFVGRLEPAGSEASKTEVPMAMVGRVPTKVSAETGPIKVGDLLVTSSTMGYAMKGTDRTQMLGAVIGKALGSLDSGTGVIEVLVTLQ
jgi:hypothetical protein